MADHDHDHDDWVSDEDLTEALAMEKHVFGRTLTSNASKRAARRLFEENAAAAANSVIRMAIHGSTEKVRFEAAKYVIERALGPTSHPLSGDGNDPLEEAMQQMMNNTKGRATDHPG